MIKKEIILLTLCTLFVAYVPLASYDKLHPSSDAVFFILKSVYGQTPDPGSSGTDPGNLDASPGTNSSDVSNATDPSLAPNGGSDISNSNDTAPGGPDITIPGVSNDFGNTVNDTTGTNKTVSQTVPEFGPISALVLTAAIVSIILMTAKTGLSSRFHK